MKRFAALAATSLLFSCCVHQEPKAEVKAPVDVDCLKVAQTFSREAKTQEGILLLPQETQDGGLILLAIDGTTKEFRKGLAITSKQLWVHAGAIQDTSLDIRDLGTCERDGLIYEVHAFQHKPDAGL